MNDFEYRAELETAEKAAREAGAIVMAMFRGKFDVREKGRNNPVTTADLRANQRIREIIRGRFPEDGWLSEEDKDSAQRLAARRVWVIDPIDGTKEFIEGVPQFAISIGFVVGGFPKVAVVFNPAEQKLYCAGAGQGAFLNGRSIHVTTRSEVEGALLLVSRSEPQRKFQVFVDRCSIEPIGSIAFRLAKVAGGDGDGTLTFRLISEWDVCAGVLIVEEAGGKVLDGAGQELTFNRRNPRHRGVIAANERLARALQVFWQKAMAETRVPVR
ncbi:MAG TPA: 3'(2'),5'-bisphosphate nucleotidase CysQ [candidate division Zixibacteria bacterium]|nr:3'(2'),5'-bisphosphate nucleotidase CysQ [candidate division Zixibacteria bacterium]